MFPGHCFTTDMYLGRRGGSRRGPVVSLYSMSLLVCLWDLWSQPLDACGLSSLCMCNKHSAASFSIFWICYSGLLNGNTPKWGYFDLHTAEWEITGWVIALLRTILWFWWVTHTTFSNRVNAVFSCINSSIRWMTKVYSALAQPHLMCYMQYSALDIWRRTWRS